MELISRKRYWTGDSRRSLHKHQFVFAAGKSTTDATYVLWNIQQMYCEKKRKMYHIFVDLEKAFDRVPRGALQWALRWKKVPEKIVRLVMALYLNSTSSVSAAGGMSSSFQILVGVLQGSALSPLLFNLVMEEATKECRRGLPWDILYADDLVLTAESMDELVLQFGRWKDALETRGLKVNISKTKVMVTGKECEEPLNSGRYPCGACGKGVRVNSFLCNECGRWVHQRCSVL